MDIGSFKSQTNQFQFQTLDPPQMLIPAKTFRQGMQRTKNSSGKKVFWTNDDPRLSLIIWFNN